MITSVPTSASCMILNLTCKVKLCFSSEQPSGKLAHCTYSCVGVRVRAARRTTKPCACPPVAGTLHAAHGRRGSAENRCGGGGVPRQAQIR